MFPAAIRRVEFVGAMTASLLFWSAQLAAAVPAGPDHTGPVETSLTSAQVAEDLELAIDAMEAALPDLYWHQSKHEWEDGKARQRIMPLAGKV